MKQVLMNYCAWARHKREKSSRLGSEAVVSTQSTGGTMGENWLHNVGEKAGLSLWRIDNRSRQISKEPNATSCVLKSDDCYILLYTVIDICGGPNKYSIYMWVGNATQIEEDTKERMSNLMQAIGAEVPYIRVQQECEPDDFKGYFKKGISYVESVTLKKQVNLRDANYPTRLFHVKGRRHPRVSLVEVSYASLNSGDVFILDDDNTIYQWNGKTSSRMEKGKALDLTTRLRDERMNRIKCEIVVMKEGMESEEFWQVLGGEGPVSSADRLMSDEEWENLTVKDFKLFKVVGVPPSPMEFVLEDVKSQFYHRDHLQDDCSYVFDTNGIVFIWNGRNSPSQVKVDLPERTRQYLKENSRPETTPIFSCPMGVEPALFKTHFQGTFTEYIDTPQAFDNRLKRIHKTAGTLRQQKVNVDELLHPEKYALVREDFVDNVPYASLRGEVIVHKEFKVFLVSKKQLNDLPPEEYGIFYSGQTYVVQFTVRSEGSTRKFVVYHWHGRKSSIQDRGSASLLAQTLASKFGRGCTLCRVIQNKEPAHFLSHFQGYMCVRTGKRDTWFEETKDKNKLYQVRGETELEATASQVECKAQSLSSNDCYVLETPVAMWVWYGKGSNNFEKQCASLLVDRVQERGGEKVKVVIEEESEPAEFWEALGGKVQYSNEPHRQTRAFKARLFQCTSRTGVFKVTEIPNFCQDDLDEDDVMLLDTWQEVFVWVGSKAGKKEKEKQLALDIATEYVEKADDGRDSECPIYTVDAGEEPIQFTAYFKGWNPKQARTGEDLYARKLAQVQKEGGKLLGLTLHPRRPRIVSLGPTADEKATVSADEMTKSLNPDGLIVDFDRLRQKPTPPGVDGAHLEAYLSDEQFDRFLKISRTDFYALPVWKQLRHKKSVGLF
eukprot:TRINITY_DN789_c0_g1_i2.p1 TRINITY_DN789_c0_g1~~TRINITY_DN789_c0_g1_i2.p1  ORF type:complete len:892 (-),score=219.66 TRINITY_DN789_c0_g1_i2:185-2860(-)